MNENKNFKYLSKYIKDNLLKINETDNLLEIENIICDSYYEFFEKSQINLVKLGNFRFLFDFSFDEDNSRDRVVAAFGFSQPPTRPRDTNRARGLIGPTQKVFGNGYDKGHFIAYSIGGDNDDSYNLFPQARHINRGWSEEGKLYRKIEQYCASHVGTFFITIPNYINDSWIPDKIYIGAIIENNFELHCFTNTPLKTP